MSKTIQHIEQVHIRNYKSLGQAVVDLKPFTAFVGPNGAGKSNFIDALSFTRDCLLESVELAFKDRGGANAVRRRSSGHPTHIGIRLVLALEHGTKADYAFEIAAMPKEKFRVARERCIVRPTGGKESYFEVRKGEFFQTIPGVRARLSPDRLALFAASATEEFRPAFDFLTSMGFYSIVPEMLRELQDPDPGDDLDRYGGNAAAVLARLQKENPERYERLCRLLSKVSEGVKSVEYRSVGQKETLRFKQDVGLKDPWTFDALNMSDGTLRVLGLLLAVYQPDTPSVVCIEEPEATVHPAVAELVMQVLTDAANEMQVLITTHSPDVLDYKDLKDEQIRIVAMRHGATLIAPLAVSSRDAIRKRLYTPGELLRSDELSPDIEEARKMSQQLDLFGSSENIAE
jgi:predicted ATPase